MQYLDDAGTHSYLQQLQMEIVCRLMLMNLSASRVNNFYHAAVF